MADLTITPGNVPAGSNATRYTGIVGETIRAGKAAFLNAATNRWMLSENNGTGTREVKGIVLNGASANQPLAVLRDGDITIGATAGGICVRADPATDMDTIQIGDAKSAAVLAVSIRDPGVTL